MTPMPHPSSGANHLPIVRYAPSPRFPGASHAAAEGRARARLIGYALYAVPLLLAAGLLLPAPHLHHARSASRDAAPLPSPAALPAPPPSWDADLDASPRPGRFVRFFRMKATAYTPINTRMEGGHYTSTLRDGRAEHGVAVDPSLIPLGSRLWIPGYGHAVADDIGGAIKGHHVDIRVQVYGHMSQWGVRPVRVYVLQEPKEK